MKPLKLSNETKFTNISTLTNYYILSIATMKEIVTSKTE